MMWTPNFAGSTFLKVLEGSLKPLILQLLQVF
jgi:hypothetical protein